jgi:hypothetical protein
MSTARELRQLTAEKPFSDILEQAHEAMNKLRNPHIHRPPQPHWSSCAHWAAWFESLRHRQAPISAARQNCSATFLYYMYWSEQHGFGFKLGLGLHLGYLF